MEQQKSVLFEALCSLSKQSLQVSLQVSPSIS